MVIETGKKVLRIESQAVAGLIDRLDEKFEKAVEAMDRCRGRVVITGMGKSGLIGKKIASTLASIGVPAFFLHPAEGVHGDLGMVVKDDLIIAISNSGETDEILQLLPTIKRFNLPLVAMTGKTGSTLAKRSDIVLDISVAEEACPLNLVPTASTTAALAMGDALAIALLDKRGFKEEDFAVFHPGGTLGRKLLTKVEDLMHVGDQLPLVKESVGIKDTIMEISRKKMGTAIVVDVNGLIAGVITDGDLRRALETHKDILEKCAGDVMGRNPKTIERDALAAKALQIMESHSITALIVSDDGKRPVGLIHLHDILKAGIV
ncbi:MAG: KpsF/GutQ family sugar-phosphate isomerase [Nitrospinae bacterium]|nr:KpsF/GutQ family sugar-phosphate isomerase [Nitrospinota bacterium]